MSLQAFLYRFFEALAGGVQRLPRARALAGGAAFATGVYALYRRSPWRGFVEGNLRVAFPEATEAWLAETARAHLVALTRAIVELLRLPALAPEALDALVRFEGWEHVEAARASGRGVIVATAHFGNWELLGAALVRRGLPLSVLVQRPSQDAFDRLFKEFRGRAGVHTYENAGAASLRPVLRALARGEGLGLLADQHGESQDAIVRFFGQAVSAPVGPFFFAARTGAAVLPVFIVRQADDTHVVHIEAEIPASLDAEADTQALYARYEAFIRRHPDHWLWVHDRWARAAELTRAPRPALEAVS